MTGPVFGEESWLFDSTPERPSMLEVVFSSPVRIRRVRIAGVLAAIDDRDADIVEMAERLDVPLMLGTCLRYRPRDVVLAGQQVKIWISKKADVDVTARFRFSEVAG